ncbi:hypothetical protein D7S86_04805 [Pararobbsia silviterrae]|uniref:Uncharacterized protein n=1 Tax=Pararobbsia silviterrae TaxID=1792498 RepID=A0A494YGR0_9BURK|nr:hypothetical protein D7S86_04805 [Pararobbsia silviterrae]
MVPRCASGVGSTHDASQRQDLKRLAKTCRRPETSRGRGFRQVDRTQTPPCVKATRSQSAIMVIQIRYVFLWYADRARMHSSAAAVKSALERIVHG